MERNTISSFREMPKTKQAWWAMWLGLSTVLCAPALTAFSTVIRPLLDPASVNGMRVGVPLGFGSVVLSLLAAAVSILLGVNAYRKGERTWVLWVGLALAALAGAFWVFVVVGELLFPH